MTRSGERRPEAGATYRRCVHIEHTALIVENYDDAIRFFVDHCATSARTPIKTVKASELRRLSIRPRKVNTQENRTARDPRPGCLVWARKGEAAHCSPNLQRRDYNTANRR